MRRALRSFFPVLTHQLLGPFLFYPSPFFRDRSSRSAASFFRPATAQLWQAAPRLWTWLRQVPVPAYRPGQ